MSDKRISFCMFRFGVLNVVSPMTLIKNEHVFFTSKKRENLLGIK